jgi:hypothetical protein
VPDPSLGFVIREGICYMSGTPTNREKMESL